MKYRLILFITAGATLFSLNKAIALRDEDEAAEAKPDPLEEYRLERLNGTLTKLSGFNSADDSSVTKISIAGNAVLDESYLKGVFKRYYTHQKEKDEDKKGKKILAKDWAYKAGREIVQNWNHSNDEESEKFLTAHFEPTWEHFDVNGDGWIDP